MGVSVPLLQVRQGKASGPLEHGSYSPHKEGFTTGKGPPFVPVPPLLLSCFSPSSREGSTGAMVSRDTHNISVGRATGVLTSDHGSNENCGVVLSPSSTINYTSVTPSGYNKIGTNRYIHAAGNTLICQITNHI